MLISKLFKFTPPEEKDDFEIKSTLPFKEREVMMEVSSYLNENIEYLDKAFNQKDSYDVMYREFSLQMGKDKVKAAIYFIDGLVSSQSVNECILTPLMIESEKLKEKDFEAIKNSLIPQNQIKVTREMKDVIKEVCYGTCAVFIDGYDKAILPQVIGWAKRGVEEPKSEPAIFGPNQAFNETLKVNTSMMRKMIRSEHLIIENLTIGDVGKCNCAVLYMGNITNPSLVSEVKKRIKSLKIDHLISSSELSQFIESRSFISLPQIISTERPDRCVKSLMSGRVVVLVDNSPLALIMPATVFELTESAEDVYLRPAYALLVKSIRYLGIILSIYLPGIYIAAITYHTTIFPTGMLTTIMRAGRKVPFDSITELVVMVITFEIIREASARVPGFLGSSLGIIGPLVLGQAAISANIVSPVMIIVFSVATIGSFATPNFSMAFSGRVLNIIFICLGSIGGFLGIAVGIFCQLMLWHETKSFGVNMLLPYFSGRDIVPEPLKVTPIWKHEDRPKFLKTKREKEQAHISRLWKR